MLEMAVDDARTQLQRAARASDLEEGQDYARKAHNALDDAEMAATDCGCDVAAVDFGDASSKAKRARDADDAEEFVDELNGAIRGYNSAISQLPSCRPRK
jgi:hypothetical protein